MIKFVQEHKTDFFDVPLSGYIDKNDNIIQYDEDTPENRKSAEKKLNTLYDCKRTIDCYNLSDSQDCLMCQDSFYLINCDSVYNSSFCQESSDLDHCHHCIKSENLYSCDHVFNSKNSTFIKHAYNVEDCSSSTHIYDCNNVSGSSYAFGQPEKNNSDGFKFKDEYESMMKDIGG
jgi:hypothetical protein